jgi:hypothetical protein
MREDVTEMVSLVDEDCSACLESRTHSALSQWGECPGVLYARGDVSLVVARLSNDPVAIATATSNSTETQT